MKALVYQGPKTLTIENWPLPVPGPGEVRVQSRLVGICGSDVHGYLGVTGRRTAPMVMGHEMSGVVSAVGEGVDTVSVGDRITVQPIFNCGVCEYCRDGLINICPTREFLGAMSCNGAFEEEFCVPAKNICKLPDAVTFEVGAMIEPFAVAYRAVSHALPLAGKTVMICGAGTIGLMALKVVKMFHAATVIMVDLSDDRLALARQHGADITINGRSDIDQALRSHGVRDTIDVAIEAVGATPTVQQTVDYVRNRGQIIWVGNNVPMVTLNMQNIVTREVNIQGSYTYTEADFLECIRLLSEEPQDFTGIISEIIPLEDAPAMFASLSEGAGKTIKVLVDVTR